MNKIAGNGKNTIILGGGLTGLSAGYALTKAGQNVRVYEGDSSVGGLSKTIVKDGFRFDLGGHRFFTTNKVIENFVGTLMNGELVSVPRKSKIYMRSKFFDYPLTPLNAIFGLGIPMTLKIMSDYGLGKVKNLINEKVDISLEDWVVRNFGRKMFNLYFREYSEKVWGIECSRISAEWVEKRIRGLSLSKAVKNAFFKFSGRDIPTLADRFLYPQLGIGRISERLQEEIERYNNVLTDTRVERVDHSENEITSITVKNHRYSDIVYGSEFVSSIPLPNLIRLLSPSPPDHIIDVASRLKFRDLIIVAVMINRERVTDQSWIYIPEKKIPFGRIHEPTNWSAAMAPTGKTLMVMEFFSFKYDETWNKSDEKLSELTVKHLQRLGFINKKEVLGSLVVRAPRAYPLFEVGYESYCNELYSYLSRFRNLYIAGRAGMFKYYNMDHAIESGLGVAEKILKSDSYHLSAISPK
ncbi:MAG: FAD-dependent oxidoreductase [Nitrospirae bacterium]|nr:FAD-dependent oxidoreductase [Nitrospirota bacterium]